MIETLKEINPDIPIDPILNLYFKNGYDEFQTIAQAVKNKDSLIFHSKSKCTLSFLINYCDF